MNPRIYKKQAKRCLELLRVHEGWGDIKADNIEKLRRRERSYHPILEDSFCNGTPVLWYRCSYEYDEWDTKCPRDMWLDLYYWTFVVDHDWRPNFEAEGDGLPTITLAQCRERFSTRMLPDGWRWRGKKAMKVTT